MVNCKFDGCAKSARYRSGYCDTHNARFKRNGHPFLVRSTSHSAHKTGLGYMRKTENGKRKLEHILIVEKVLGHALPSKAVVHHVNENGSDNRNSNLVVCQDQAYHLLLHRRQDALAVSGHADWRKCKFCKTYSAPNVISVDRNEQAYHKSCAASYQRERKAA